MTTEENFLKRILRAFPKSKTTALFARCAVMFLFVGTLHAQGQNAITLNLKDATLEQAIGDIESHTDYRFLYNKNLVDVSQRVSIRVSNQPLESVLRQLLANTHISYTINNKQVVLQQGSQSAAAPPPTGRRIAGNIVDAEGEPVIGATVIVKGDATKGTVTDFDGNYALANVPPNAVISISYVGYQPLELPADSPQLANIVLKEDSEMLDEVVVVGYGTQRRRDVTTAIASLKSSEMQVPVSSVDQAIAGKLAGVQVLQPNGIPGGGMSIKVRGTGTISAGTDPLYVVDGFPMSDEASNAAGVRVNPLSSINMNDIESIEVLKDASAAAIYGSRGSNGVVIITTKRGADRKPLVQYDGYFGKQVTAKKIEMMDAYQQAQILFDARNNTYFDALQRAGLQGSASDTNDERRAKLGQSTSNTRLNYLIPEFIYPYLEGKQGLTNTDWQDEISRTATIHSHNLSVTGGTKEAQYFVSANYRNEEGIIIGTGFNQIGGRAKIDVRYDKFTFGANASFNSSSYELVPSEDRYANETITSGALGYLPSLPVYDANGNFDFTQYDLNHGVPNLINPIALALLRDDKMLRYRTMGNLYADYEFIPNLKFKMNFGVDYNNYRRNVYRPSTLPTSVNRTPPSIPTGQNRTKDVLNWVWENLLSYNTIFDTKHNLSVMAGWTAQKETLGATFIQGTGFPNDLVKTLNAATVVTDWSTTGTAWSLLSGLARAQYGYLNKYLFSAAIRADGSSRFGPSNRWGYFPSLSAGWYITEENFLQDQRNWLTNLKLRSSYGQTGNFSIGNYEYYALLSEDNYILGLKESIASGLVPSSAGNPQLGWEKTSMLNVGLEVGLFDMLFLEADLYTSTTSDMLLSVPVPELSGYSAVLKNIGKMRNKGLELTLSTKNNWRKFHLANSLNFSLNRNKVVDLGGVNQMIVRGETMEFITKVGEPIGNYYGYVIDGVFMNQAEIDIANNPNDKSIAQVPNAKPGDFKYADQDGDGKITSSDKTIIGNYAPDFTYGFSTQMTYKNFDLNFSLQGVHGNKIANINRRYLNNMEGGSNQIEGLNRWQSEADPGNGRVNKANRSQTGMNGQMSTWHIEDGSYLRVRNITMGYSLDETLANQIGISKLRVYLTAQNPFTFTKYSGYNPEVDMKNNPLTPGIDYGTYPLSKSLVIGLNLTF